ncbi:hypothetical protein IP92_00952 [Pseudoduganella flava]|uniref:DUF5610 domain-containing protein n=1 Tax=Pseudoduganella flava TaxID=871742 RepID=A0A562PZ65_9BURK|nr:hypothetical protein [Pseudoduganella flava]QGZ38694.1 hypothetical protein GO485_06240 [Pseudoduganella flava]TWI49731.1 hypothetical protein IP92_00952 [Pseudoduganella flava]
MSSISPLGARQYQNTALAGSSQQPQRGNSAVQQTGAAKSSNVALSPGGVDLQQRVDALGNNTIDLAQQFLGSFAQKLLGDDAKSATIAFDSVALEASSSMAAGVMHAEGGGRVTDAAAFSLNESSHFLGKGTITLADGSKYDFEVEVQYEASMTAGASQDSEREKLIEQNPAMPLPAIEFPDIDWPGSLADLFKLMDKQVSGDVRGTDQQGVDGQGVGGQDGAGDKLGTLSLRLLKLVNSAEALDTYGPPDAKAAAKAYAAELAAGAGKEADKETTKDAIKTPVKTDQVDTPVKSAADIPLTISTNPPAPDEA